MLRENALVGLFELAVVIVEEVDLTQAQDLRRFLQLALTDSAQLRRPGIVFRGPEPAFLAAGSCHKVGLNALGRVLGEDASYTQRFVIRVGENAEESGATRGSAAQTWPIRWTSTVPSNHSGSEVRYERSVSYHACWSG